MYQDICKSSAFVISSFSTVFISRLQISPVSLSINNLSGDTRKIGLALYTASQSPALSGSTLQPVAAANCSEISGSWRCPHKHSSLCASSISTPAAAHSISFCFLVKYCNGVQYLLRPKIDDSSDAPIP